MVLNRVSPHVSPICWVFLSGGYTQIRLTNLKLCLEIDHEHNSMFLIIFLSTLPLTPLLPLALPALIFV